MTTQQKVDMAKVILPALAGAAGSYASSRQQNTQNQLSQQQNQLGQMSNQANIAQMLQQMKMQQAQAGLNAMPLGLEQQYVQKQRMMQALLPALANYQSARPTDPGIMSAYKPGSNIVQQMASNPQLQQSFGDQSLETALGNYRRLVAQADPRISMQSLSGYGLGTGQDQGVEDVRMTALADQKAYEQGQTDLAQQQTDMTKGQQAAQPEKKKGGFWSKVGSIAKVAVPIVLAATGVGIPAAMAITAGTNIAASKMQGKSWGDALQSGAVGAATGAVGAGALGGATRAGMSAATQKAIVQGALSGADAKMQGGSWGDAVTSGVSGAAASKLGDMAKAKFQNGSSDGLNNQMGPQSLPLGAQNTDANNPMAGWQQALKNSPSMQLASKPMPMMQSPQPVQQQAPQYPMVNKVKQAVIGSGAQPTTPPGQVSGQGPQGIPLNPARYPVPSYGSHAPVDKAYDLPRIGAGRPGEADPPNQFWETFKQQPFLQQMSNPMVGMMGGGVLSAVPRGVAAAGVGQKLLSAGNQPQLLGTGQKLLGAGQKLLPEYSASTQNEIAAMRLIEAAKKLPPDEARNLINSPMAQIIFGGLK